MNRSRLAGAIRKEFRRILAFGLVGLAAFAAYLAAVSLVVENGGHPVLGAVAGFAVGTAVSFAGNCRWVFKAPPSAVAGARFLVTTLAGFVLNVALAWLLTRLGVHYALMTLVIFLVVPAFNYLGHRLWTFSGGGPARELRNG